MTAAPTTPLRLIHGAAGDADAAPQMPPHDLDAEASVISAVIIDAPSVLPRIATFLRPEHFYSEAHRRIYEAALSIAKAGEPVDATTILIRLKDTGRLVDAGGAAYVTEVMNAAPAISNVMAYAVPVFDLARVRSAMGSAHEFLGRGYLRDVGEGVQAFLDSAARAFAMIARRTAISRVETNAETLKRIIETVSALGLGGASDPGIPTGFARYDQLTRGLHQGEKTLVVALPKVGKTAFALQVAVNAAKQGVGVLYLSQEVSRDECLTRVLASEAHVDSDKLRTGRLSQSEWSRLTTAIEAIERLPLWIDDSPGMHVDQVCASVMVHIDRARSERKVPLGLFVVDYIQRLDRAPGEERLPKHEYLGNAARKITNLARSMKIACIELAQRKPAEVDKVTKVRKEPVSGETAECSQIEREAHAVVYLFRNPKRTAGGAVVGEDAARVTLRLALQRGGGQGDVQLEYEGSQYRFTAIDPPHGEDDDGERFTTEDL